MKKYFYLLFITIIIISLIIMSGFIINKDSSDVYTLKITYRDIDNTVSAQGRLQYSTDKPVIAKNECIIDKVLVNDGDYINKGDPVYSYYKTDKYKNVIAEYPEIKNIYANISHSDTANNTIKKLKEYAVSETVYADKSGNVSGVNISDGDFVEKGSEILRISEKESFEISVNINETSIEKIETGQRAEITFTALKDKVYNGTVTSVANEAKQTSGLTGKETSVEVIITLDDIVDNVRPGYTANCSIITSTDKNVIIIPYECIRSDDSGEYVYKINKSKAVKTYIKTGTEYKDGVLVKSGIKSGEVLIKNCDSVHNGQNVIIKKENTDD
ncbi:MAG: efflux RND transporter periplasmic adaptor subunit [Clostridia bacterium]|nr:efflux RND transporter periplasmic adaptor subunit [Clostridia bacterium]